MFQQELQFSRTYSITSSDKPFSFSKCSALKPLVARIMDITADRTLASARQWLGIYPIVAEVSRYHMASSQDFRHNITFFSPFHSRGVYNVVFPIQYFFLVLVICSRIFCCLKTYKLLLFLKTHFPVHQ